eukprot:g30551.t1
MEPKEVNEILNEYCASVFTKKKDVDDSKVWKGNLIELFEEVKKMIDEDRAVDVINVDLTKAFGKLPHDAARPTELFQQLC